MSYIIPPIPAQLCPTAHHWGGSIGVYNIARTNKKTGEKVIVESNLHSNRVDPERRAYDLWGEQGDALDYYFDTELVGYYPVVPNPVRVFQTICPICGK